MSPDRGGLRRAALGAADRAWLRRGLGALIAAAAADRSSLRRALAALIAAAALVAACDYPARDMRQSVVVSPQEAVLEPPEGSVPEQGREDVVDITAADALVNPVPADTTSVRRGEQAFVIYCTPCHGARMDGQGPVAAKFMPTPNLLAKLTRDRTDGYIYRYVRHGGAVMPRYGFALTSERVWDVVNFVRHMQRTTPL